MTANMDICLGNAMYSLVHKDMIDENKSIRDRDISDTFNDLIDTNSTIY